MNKLSTLCALLLGMPVFLHAQATTGDIPYAKQLLNSDGTLKVWTIGMIRNDKTLTINPGGNSTKEKDIRSNSDMLGYSSLTVEKGDDAREFSGTLDLSNAVLPAKIAILVDDIAILQVKEIERKEGVEGPVFSDNFRVNGTALWNPRSYTEFPTHLPPGRKYKLDLTYSNTANLTPKYEGGVDIDGVSVYVSLLPAEIIPDYNRDGRIDESDRGKVTAGNPWRWWINDDNDLTTAERGNNLQDVPKQNAASRDCNDLAVDGMRDHIDFFPLHLKLKAVLEVLPESEYKYVLKHEEEALKFYEFPTCVVDGSVEGREPNRHVKDVGAGRALAAKDLKLASIQGSELSANMLAKVKDEKGIVVIEGAKKTEKPLVLEILKKSDNSSIAEIEFPIRIVDVEAMFRQVNMRDVMGGTGGNPTQTDEPPGYPDELTNGKYVAYVHGFNVSGESARGSQSNIFKRFHQLGSKARYIGISWFGNPPSPINLDALPDYHLATYNGLTTAIVARVRLSFTQDSNFTVLAHSLGNSLVGSAIVNHGLKVDQYYIINGAIPLQAYDSSQTSNSSGHPDMKRNMTEDDWKPYYDYGDGAEEGKQQRLFASNWHELFDTSDKRSKLTWKNLFADPALLSVAYNFYSPSDEVVENADETEEVGHLDNVWLAVTQGRHAWVQQEIAKGGQSIISGPAFHEINGGWEFNYNPPFGVGGSSGGVGYYKNYFFEGSGLYRKYTPEEAANEISDADLRTKPFHQHFLYENLYDPAQGSVTAGVTTNKYKLLGTGIPATSYAIAANNVPKLDQVNGGEQRNFDMPQDMRSPGGYSSWPEHENSNTPEDWMHSDFKDVALHFLHPMYQKMIDLAELNKD